MGVSEPLPSRVEVKTKNGNDAKSDAFYIITLIVIG